MEIALFVLNKFIKYLPFWTSLMGSHADCLDQPRLSNCAIKSFFGLLKSNFFKTPR